MGSKDDIKKILFLPHSGSMICEMLPIAKRIIQDGIYQPVFFPQKLYLFSDEQLDLLYKQKIDFIVPPVPLKKNLLSTDEKPVISVSSISRRIINRISTIIQTARTNFTPKLLAEIYAAWVSFRFQLSEARSFLKREKVSALVLIGDRHIGWETAFIKAAHERKTPSLITPFALSSPHSNAAYRTMQPDYKKSYGVQTLLAQFITLLFPKWVYIYKGEKLFYSTVINSLAAWLTGIMPRNPWLIGGGSANSMAVESQWCKELYLHQGICEEKMIITGKPSLDDLVADLRQNNGINVHQDMNLPGETRILLFAVPQFGEHKLMSWEDHWKEIEFLLSTFSKLPGVSVVLSIHPRSDPEEYRSLAEKYGALIAEERYFKMLPKCYAFVAVESSTVLTSVGLNKPTLVLGYYIWHEGVYDNAPGVVTVHERNLLEPTIMRLFNDKGYYSELTVSQKIQSADWILLDGKCTERVVNELYRLIA